MGRHGPSSGSSSSSGFGDTSLTKVFVGGLAWETQSETMRQYFRQFGDILEAVVITDKITGRSKGYGFVTFKDSESARRACVDPAPIIDGRRANCNLASLGSPRHVLPFGGSVGSPTPFAGGMPSVRGPYFASYGYQQPLPFSYQQGLAYPPYTVFTTHMRVNSIFKYMDYPGQSMRKYIHTIKWVKLLQIIRVLHLCRVIRCLVNRLCSLMGRI